MDNRRFIPTDIGKIVNRFLTQYFHQYVEYGFTAALEDELDAVSRGEEDWTLPLTKFWKPFVEPGGEDREERLARAGRAGARDRQGPGQRQADERAHGPVRPVRADRHQGRRGEAEVRGPASRAEDGRDHARAGARALQAAAHARRDGRRREGRHERRPLRPLCEVRREVRLAEGRRSVHRRAAARARADPPEEGGGCESHHRRIPRSRHPGAERPLRPVRHRRQEEREDSQGSRSEVADARGLQTAHRGCAGALRPLWQGQGQVQASASAEAAAKAQAAPPAEPRKARARKSPPDPQTTRVVRKKSARTAAAAKKKRA